MRRAYKIVVDERPGRVEVEGGSLPPEAALNTAEHPLWTGHADETGTLTLEMLAGAVLRDLLRDHRVPLGPVVTLADFRALAWVREARDHPGEGRVTLVVEPGRSDEVRRTLDERGTLHGVRVHVKEP
jgi:hypothetical protein